MLWKFVLKKGDRILFIQNQLLTTKIIDKFAQSRYDLDNLYFDLLKIMDTIELRKHIEQNLLQISADNLKIIAEFVEFIKQKENAKNIDYPLPENISYKPASGQSVLRHAGQWVGDDLQNCLDLVNQTRGKVLINKHINPFE